jgi:hypothetical protein
MPALFDWYVALLAARRVAGETVQPSVWSKVM